MKHTVKGSVQTVLLLLVKIKHPMGGFRLDAITDHGFCGPRGRVLTSTGNYLGCKIIGNFHRSETTGCYELHLSLEVPQITTSLTIIKAAAQLAELHENVPAFNASETDEIFAILDDEFGVKAG